LIREIGAFIDKGLGDFCGGRLDKRRREEDAFSEGDAGKGAVD
jgi:hypothetical protein